MRTPAAFQRRGVATKLLEQVIATARQRGYHRLGLETGNPADFAAARALYARYGFTRCPPFGSYVDDGFSVCVALDLAPDGP